MCSCSSKSTNQRAAILEPATNVFVAGQGEKRKTSTETCNETMLRDKLRIFVYLVFCRLIPFTPWEWLTPDDFTLSDARRFYLSKADSLGLKGLKNYLLKLSTRCIVFPRRSCHLLLWVWVSMIYSCYLTHIHLLKIMTRYEFKTMDRVSGLTVSCSLVLMSVCSIMMKSDRRSSNFSS